MVNIFDPFGIAAAQTYFIDQFLKACAVPVQGTVFDPVELAARTTGALEIGQAMLDKHIEHNA